MGIELLAPVDDLVGLERAAVGGRRAPSRATIRRSAGRSRSSREDPARPRRSRSPARVQMPLYHLMGGGPWRRTVFLRPDGTVPDEADWVAVPLFVHPRLDPSTWKLLPGTGTGEAWTIYRRVG